MSSSPPVAALGAFLFCAVSSAAPPSLTLPEALRRFEEKGFDLLLAEAAVQSAEADLSVAGAVANPSLNGSAGRAFTYDPTPCAGSGCSAVSWGVGLGDNGALFDALWGKRGARVKGAQAALAAARLSRDDARRTLHFQLRAAMVEAARTTLALEHVRSVLGRLEQVEQLNRVRFQTGAISESDLAKVETERLEAEADVDRAVLAQAQATVAVAFLLGERGGEPSFVVDRGVLEAPLPPLRADVTVASLVKEATAHRPDLLAAGQQVARADAALDGAHRLVLPEVQLGPQFSMLGFGQQALSPPVLSLAATVALPVFSQYQGEVARAEADRRAQVLQREKLNAQVTADVAAAWAQDISARRRLARMNGALRERATRTRDLVQLQYQKGAASLLELLDAERQLVSINLEFVQDLADAWNSTFQLAQALGTEEAP